MPKLFSYFLFLFLAIHCIFVILDMCKDFAIEHDKLYKICYMFCTDFLHFGVFFQNWYLSSGGMQNSFDTTMDVLYWHFTFMIPLNQLILNFDGVCIYFYLLFLSKCCSSKIVTPVKRLIKNFEHDNQNFFLPTIFFK